MQFQPGSYLCQEIHLNTGHFSMAPWSSSFLYASCYCHGAQCLMFLLQAFCQLLINSNKALNGSLTKCQLEHLLRNPGKTKLIFCFDFLFNKQIRWLNSVLLKKNNNEGDKGSTTSDAWIRTISSNSSLWGRCQLSPGLSLCSDTATPASLIQNSSLSAAPEGVKSSG